MTTDWLAYLRGVSVQRLEAQVAANAADERWREIIRAGLAAGIRADEIAKAAGISRQRVYQIRDGKR